MTGCRFKHHRLWLWVLASVAAALMAALLLPADLFLSSPTGDLEQFASARAFAADNLRAGHFPLWNPLVYSGQPFLGNFQSALLYPPNVVFFLPIARAVNLSFLLHLSILGWGAGLWASRRGCHPLAAVLAGLVLALSGPVFPRLYSGHLPNLCTMAWTPWMLLALEAAWRGPILRPLLLAMAMVSLQIFAGQLQYVFYVAIATCLHAVVQSVFDPAVRRRALPLVVAAYAGGAALAAIQLLPGLAALAESVRQGRLDYSFVRSFSFPPENLLTFLAPGFFGDLASNSYWGRCYLWEVVPFIGATGLALAGFAALTREQGRRAGCDLLVAALLLVLALGDHTPLLRVLYYYAPGFDRLRCLAKFTFPLTLFATPALAFGADALIRGRQCPRFYPILLALAGALAIGAGVLLWLHPGSIAGLMASLQHDPDGYLPAINMNDEQFVRDAGRHAGHSLAIGGALLATTGLALWRARTSRFWRWVPLALLAMEMVAFAQSNFASTRIANLAPQPVREYIATHPGDYRVLTPERPDDSYFLGAANMWGNNPNVLKRYAEFIAYSQGGNPDLANQYAPIRHVTQAFGLVRFGAVIDPNPAAPGTFQIQTNLHPLPHALLVANYKVLPGRDAILPALFKPDFDPEKIVYLETEPSPAPQAIAANGAVKVSDSSSDSLTVEADTPAPSLLLITDLYSRDWRARPLPGSTQPHYDILPADYFVRAIPLAAGHHHLVVEYAPSSLKAGILFSTLASLGWAMGFIWSARKPKVRSQPKSSQ